MSHPTDVAKSAAAWAQRNQQRVFVTLAEKGMLCASADGSVEHVPAFPLRGEIDVVGAGDSVTANITAADKVVSTAANISTWSRWRSTNQPPTNTPEVMPTM